MGVKGLFPSRSRVSSVFVYCAAAALWLSIPAALSAQRGGPPRSPKDLAPVDLTGDWVSVVTNSEQWLFRMQTPPKGDFKGIGLTAEARAAANAWDPAKDEAAGEQCKAYGAPAIMAVPGHFRISWTDDRTLRIETDAGKQTRLLHFGPRAAPTGEPQLQGASAAAWDSQGGRGTEGGGSSQMRKQGDSLKVVTTNLRPGYLFKNGIPYSGNAVLTEYFNRIEEPNGDSYLIVTEFLEDPRNFPEPFIRPWYFKKVSDGAGWNPSECTGR